MARETNMLRTARLQNTCPLTLNLESLRMPPQSHSQSIIYMCYSASTSMDTSFIQPSFMLSRNRLMSHLTQMCQKD